MKRPCPPSPSLRSERLLIDRFTAADAPAVLALVNDPGWLTYIGDRDIHSVVAAEAYLEDSAASAPPGMGLFAIRRGKEVLGMCSLLQREYLEDPDLGFALLADHVGQGYAAEASRLVIDYAFDTLGVASLSAITLPENRSSIALLERLGFHSEGLVDNGTESLCHFRLRCSPAGSPAS
ncbi:MAG: GNAT family N-acetyltransferase [Pseudomonadota bacterium]